MDAATLRLFAGEEEQRRHEHRGQGREGRPGRIKNGKGRG
jgi:hypothetical protein